MFLLACDFLALYYVFGLLSKYLSIRCGDISLHTLNVNITVKTNVHIKFHAFIQQSRYLRLEYSGGNNRLRYAISNHPASVAKKHACTKCEFT